MEAGNVHAQPQIEAVRPVALCSRVQMQELAVVFPRLIAQPIDQSLTVRPELSHHIKTSRYVVVAICNDKSVSRHRVF